METLTLLALQYYDAIYRPTATRNAQSNALLVIALPAFLSGRSFTLLHSQTSLAVSTPLSPCVLFPFPGSLLAPFRARSRSATAPTRRVWRSSRTDSPYSDWSAISSTMLECLRTPWGRCHLPDETVKLVYVRIYILY